MLGRLPVGARHSGLRTPRRHWPRWLCARHPVGDLSPSRTAPKFGSGSLAEGCREWAACPDGGGRCCLARSANNRLFELHYTDSLRNTIRAALLLASTASSTMALFAHGSAFSKASRIASTTSISACSVMVNQLTPLPRDKQSDLCASVETTYISTPRRNYPTVTMAR